jgi:hypothetical protein
MIAAKQRLERKKEPHESLPYVFTLKKVDLSTRVSLKIIWLLPSDVFSNNSPRTTQGISDLNTRNMKIFRLEIDEI